MALPPKQSDNTAQKKSAHTVHKPANDKTLDTMAFVAVMTFPISLIGMLAYAASALANQFH